MVRTETEALAALTRLVDETTQQLATGLETYTAPDAQIAAAITRYAENLETQARASIGSHRDEGRRRTWEALAAMLLLLGRVMPPLPAVAVASTMAASGAAKSLAAAWSGAVMAAFLRWKREVTDRDQRKLAVAVRGASKSVRSKVGTIATTEVASAVNDTAHVAASVAETAPLAPPPEPPPPMPVASGPYRTPGAISPAEVLPIEPPPPPGPPASEVVEKGRVRWYWDAILDARVCPVCAAKDGETLEPGKGLWPPAHPRCRCVATPQEL